MEASPAELSLPRILSKQGSVEGVGWGPAGLQRSAAGLELGFKVETSDLAALCGSRSAQQKSFRLVPCSYVKENWFALV